MISAANLKISNLLDDHRLKMKMQILLMIFFKWEKLEEERNKRRKK